MLRQIFKFKYFQKQYHSYMKNYGIRRNINKISVVNSTTASLLLGSQLRNSFVTIQEESQLLDLSKGKIDLDNDLRKACEEGEFAILNLMNQLKDLVISASEEYRKCLYKQIELIQKANNRGPLSELWDDMPQYRTLADELNKELSEYLILFKMIGEIAYDQSMLSFDTNIENFTNVCKQYKDLEILVLTEFEENKKLDIKLLQIKQDNILKSIKNI